MKVSYSTKVHVKEIPVERLLKRYTDPPAVLEACRACPAYGNEWSCPPGVPDVYEYLKPFSKSYVVAVQVFYPPETRALAHNLKEAMELRENSYDHVRRQLHCILMELEKEVPGGMSISACLLCNRCARYDGLPCRHPESLRYAMTALGFTFAGLLSEEMGIDLVWGGDTLPEYDVLTAALFSK